ncbi:MAG: hypothetical protein ACC660_08895, partial [Acidimicrobiales bacterium]
ISEALADLALLVELAPDELAADVGTVSRVYTEVLNALSTTAPGAHDDVLRDLQGQLDSAADPALARAAYPTSVCGLSFDAPEQPTPSPTPLDLDD